MAHGGESSSVLACGGHWYLSANEAPTPCGCRPLHRQLPTAHIRCPSWQQPGHNPPTRHPVCTHLCCNQQLCNPCVGWGRRHVAHSPHQHGQACGSQLTRLRYSTARHSRCESHAVSRQTFRTHHTCDRHMAATTTNNPTQPQLCSATITPKHARSSPHAACSRGHTHTRTWLKQCCSAAAMSRSPGCPLRRAMAHMLTATSLTLYSGR